MVKGYTAKVGLRKPVWDEPSWQRTFLPVDMLVKAPAGSLCAAAGLMDTIRQAMDTVEALEHPAVVQRHWTTP